MHIPLSELKNRIKELNEDKNYCAICQFGERARKAYLSLKKAGITSWYLKSGMENIGEI
jgi:rhodanese-related sulfurtransferase